MESDKRTGSEEPMPRDRGYAPFDVVCQIHDDFHAALAAELVATKEADRREAIRLPQGSLERADGLTYDYLFRLKPPIPRWLRHPPGVMRFPGRAPTRASFRLLGRTLWMAFLDDLGPSIPAGVLLWPDTTWLVAGLRDRIEEIAAAYMTGDMPHTPFNFHTALAAIGEQRPGTLRAGLSDLPYVPFGLDSDQVEAVLHGHASRVHWLWGPPGSGKTKTVGESCLLHTSAGRTLLVSGPTHVAVDLILDPILERLWDDLGREDGRVIRLGRYPSKHLQPEHADAVLYDRVLERRRSALRAEAMRIRAEVIKLASPGTPNSSEELVALRTRLADVGRTLTNLPWTILNDACVVAGTMHGVLLTRLLRRDFQAVALDEVSMAAAPLVYAIAGLATDHVLLSGDFAQLPVPVSCSDPTAVSALTTDVYRRAHLHDDVARGTLPPALSVLRTQYRLPPSICDVVNDIFYAGLLRTTGDVDRHSDGSLVLVDTSALRPRVHRVSGSRRITVHATLVSDLVVAIQTKRSATGRPAPRIRVVTPYRAQMRQLHRELRARGATDGVEVSTVHRAQGSEIDIVIIDLAEAPGLPPSQFVQGESADDVGPRLLNTAATRTLEHCIFVADVAFVMTVGGRTVQEILQRVCDVGRVVDAQELLARLTPTRGARGEPGTPGMVHEWSTRTSPISTVI